MIKTFRRQLVAILLVLLMVIAIMAPAVYADSEVGSITLSFEAGNVVFYATNSSDDSSHGSITQVSDDTVEMTASGISGCSGDSPSTTTVTVTKPAGTKLTFTYTMVDGGSFTVSDEVHGEIRPAGNYYVIGEDVSTFSITSKADANNTVTVTVDSLELALATEYIVNVAPAANGTIKVGGTAVTEATTFSNISDSSGLSLTAEPASGYVFLGYSDSNCDENSYLSVIPDYIYYPYEDNVTVTAVFISASAGGFLVGDGAYGYQFTDDFSKATDELAYDGCYIIPVNEVSVPSGNYTIPSGATLLVPCDDELSDPGYEPATTVCNNTTQVTQTINHYAKLTFRNGANVTVEDGATVIVNAVIPATTPNNPDVANGPVAGKYGQIQMDEGSVMSFNGSSHLYAWGFVTGKGHIYMNDTSEAYEHYQIIDWRGGTNISNMDGNGQFPFNQYFVQNVECYLTFVSTAKEIAHFAIWIPSWGETHIAYAEFIGSDGSFILEEGSTLTKYYDPVLDKCIYTIVGDASIGTINMDLNVATISSDEYYLPIHNISVVVKDGDLSTSQKVLFLPTSSMTVDEGASVTVGNGGDVVFAGEDIGNYSALGGTAYAPTLVTRFSPSREPVAVKPTKTAAASALEGSAAVMNNNGTVTVAEGGNLASTTDGANLYSSTTGGVFVINGTMTPPELYEYQSGGTTYVPTQEVVLQNDSTGNAGGTVAYTSERWSDDFAARFAMLTIDGVKAWYDVRNVTYQNRLGTTLATYNNMAVTQKAEKEALYPISNETEGLELNYTVGDITYRFFEWKYTLDEQDSSKVTAAPGYAVFTPAVAETCTTDGFGAYYAYSGKYYTYDNEGGTFTEVTLASLSVPATGHDWTGGTTFVWDEEHDYDSCSMAQVCAHDSSHINAVNPVPAMNIYDAATQTLTKKVTFKDDLRISHTPNLDDDGTQLTNYGNSLNLNDVLTIPGATRLRVQITFGGESNSYDWTSVWAGSHPDYTAEDDYSTAITTVGSFTDGKIGGGSHTAASNTIEFFVDGDTVTFGFRSDSSGCGDGYGYYAVISDANVVLLGEDVVVTHVLENRTLTFTEHPAIAPLCDVEGTLTYYTDTDGRFYFKDGDIYTEVTEEDTLVPVPVIGHDWSTLRDYVWNEDHTVCEKYYVCSNDNSHRKLFESYDTTNSYDSSTHQLTHTAAFKGDPTIAHTANVSDDGTKLRDYDKNLATKDVVTIPGADMLHVELTYGTESGYDVVFVFEGVYDGAVERNMEAGQMGRYTGGSNDVKRVEFDVPGDTVTFAFCCDGYGCFYGYYAVVSARDDIKTYTETVDLTFTRHRGIEANCLHTGNLPYWTCGDDRYYFQDGTVYTETTWDEIELPMTGHDWNDEATYTWADDYSTCTKAFTCKNDPSHVSPGTEITVDSVLTQDETTHDIPVYNATFGVVGSDYSHTSNINDAGTRSGDYLTNVKTKDVVSIPGAERLHVKLTYGTENNWDMLYVFDYEYTGVVDRNMSGDYIAKYMGGNNTLTTVEFDILGDTATFAFYSDGSGNYYGYYAVITSVADTQSIALYNVSWDLDGDGTADETATVEGGAELSHALPVKTDTEGLEEDETWVFAGWDYAYTAKLDGTAPIGSIETYMDGTRKDNGSSVLAEADGNITFTAKFAKSGKLFKSHSISVKEDIGTNFYMDLSSLIQDPSSGFVLSGSYVQFTWGSDPDHDGAPFTQNVYISKVNAIPTLGSRRLNKNIDLAATGAGDDFLYKACADVAAKEMNDTITAVLYDGSGKMVGSDTYKASDYLYTVVNDREKALELCDNDSDKADKLQALCRSTLIYGAKAQLQFRYNTNNLVDEDLADNSFTMMSTSDFAPYSIFTNPYSAIAASFSELCVTYYGNALSLNSQVAYNLFFMNQGYVPMTITATSGADSYTVTNTVVNSNDGQDEGYDDGDYRRFDIVDIPVAKLLDDITLTFAPEGGSTYTFTVNAQTYMYNAMWLVETYGTGYDDTRYLADVISTLYDYSVKAAAYFA